MFKRLYSLAAYLTISALALLPVKARADELGDFSTAERAKLEKLVEKGEISRDQFYVEYQRRLDAKIKEIHWKRKKMTIDEIADEVKEKPTPSEPLPKNLVPLSKDLGTVIQYCEESDNHRTQPIDCAKLRARVGTAKIYKRKLADGEDTYYFTYTDVGRFRTGDPDHRRGRYDHLNVLITTAGAEIDPYKTIEHEGKPITHIFSDEGLNSIIDFSDKATSPTLKFRSKNVALENGTRETNRIGVEKVRRKITEIYQTKLARAAELIRKLQPSSD